MTAESYPRWGLVGVGRGGSDLASQVLTRATSDIDDRILLVNSNVADARRSLDRIEAAIDDRNAIGDDRVAVVGSRLGPETSVFAGDRMAREGASELLGSMTDVLGGTDALLYTVALGGGTESEVPSILDRTTQAPTAGGPTAAGGDTVAQTDASAGDGWGSSLSQFVIATMPFESAQACQHFNAVCLLFRLLGADGRRADMTVLASSTEVNGQLGAPDLDRDEAGSHSVDEQAVNDRIATAVDLFVGAGRRADNPIDDSDFLRPQRTASDPSTSHATFGLARELPIGLDLSAAMDRAAENAFVPMDLSTVESAFAVVRAPAPRVDAGDVTNGQVRKAFAEWKAEHGFRATPGMATLSRGSGEGRTFDVLLVLAGFGLDPLLDRHREPYETVKARLRERGAYHELARAERLERDSRR
jgi:hypothetical protein